MSKANTTNGSWPKIWSGLDKPVGMAAMPTDVAFRRLRRFLLPWYDESVG